MPRQQIDQWPYGRQQRVGTRPSTPSYGRPAANPFARPAARPAARPFGRPAAPTSSARLLQVAFVAAAVLILGGCLTGFALAAVSTQSAAPATADVIADAGGAGGVSAFGLPFATGTRISITKGPHSDNYGSVQGPDNVVYWLSGQGSVLASIDLGTRVGEAVHPVSSGRVLAAWPECNVIVVDHGDGVWAEYVHVVVAVSNGQAVDRNTVLGTVRDGYDRRGQRCNDYSSGPHLHFAFISGSGTSGTYVGIAGKVLCGHTINSNGDIVGLGTLGGGDFTVPNCDATGPQPVTPKPVTPQPVTPAPVTPAPVTPPAAAGQSSCDVPSLASPGSSQSFASTQDVTLTWDTNCSQTYAELTGAPYGTLSFSGWQSGRSIHIGQMWPGTYTWHVKGKSAAGQETGWSDTRSFTIASSAGPVVTDPPAPVVTDPPAPVVTDPPAPVVTDPPAPVTNPPAPIVTKGPCPFMDGGNGVTFYSGPNFTGQAWTWYVPAGNGDAYADLPAGLFRNLGSFYVSNNAWHVVLYQGENGTGNLGHYDASWANVDSYWHNTESVKIYINRTSC